MKWECSSECKPLTETEVDAIVSLRAAFENPMQEVRHALETCDDGCPNQHYANNVADSSVDLRGHTLVCSKSENRKYWCRNSCLLSHALTQILTMWIVDLGAEDNFLPL